MKTVALHFIITIQRAISTSDDHEITVQHIVAHNINITQNQLFHEQRIYQNSTVLNPVMWPATKPITASGR